MEFYNWNRYTAATEPEGRLAAIVDFTFNLGAGRLQTSTLRRRVNQKDWIAAVAGTVAANYQTCHENAEQLRALQAWVSEMTSAKH